MHVDLIANHLLCYFLECHRQADVVIMVDASGASLSAEGEWQNTLNLIKNVTNILEISENQLNIAIVKFSLLAEVDTYLDEGVDKNTLDETLNTLRQTDLKTNAGAALALVRQEIFRPSSGDRTDAPNVAVLVLRNTPVMYMTETLLEADMSRRENIRILSVSTTDRVERGFLSAIAYDDAEVYVSGDDPDKLVHDIAAGINRAKAKVCKADHAGNIIHI